jgi:tetratricopeptide (TPR) repeat protein
MKRLISRPAIFLAVLITGFSTGNLKAQSDLATAQKLTRSEQYDKAQAMLKDLIQKEPTNSKNYFFLGENYLLDYSADTISNSLAVYAKDAKEVYQKGTEANPNDPLNFVGLAKVAFYLDDYKTATDMRAKAKSILPPVPKNLKKINPPAPEYAFALAQIAESYVREGKVDTSQALPLVREALKIDSKNRDVNLVAGDIYNLVNDGTKAIYYYNQAEFADPESPTAEMKIGYIYVRGRALQAAIPYFEKAIELNANYAPAYRELGQLYLSAQRYDQSKEYFRKYLDLTAGNIPAKTRYVNALFFAKDYDGVITNVEDIFKVDKSRTYMNRIAGYSCYEKNPPDYNKALSYMETLFKTVPADRILWKDYLYMARILVKKNLNYPKLADDLKGMEQKLEKDKIAPAATAADKAKKQATIADDNTKINDQKDAIAKTNAEIDRAFINYGKVLTFKPGDRSLLSEMASNYNMFRRYDDVAKTMSKLLDPSKDNTEDLLRIGRAYYNSEKYKTADSVFSAIITKSPDYVPAYLWMANTYSKMDPDLKQGLAKPKFEKLIEVAKSDSVKNAPAMMDAFGYLSYYHMMNGNFNRSKDYYQRMVNLDPNNKDYKIKGYSGIGSVELRATSTEKTNEGRLPYLSRSTDAYNKILAIDPNNAQAKAQIAYIHEFEASIKKGINPNEIKGKVIDPSGKPVPYASIRVKDTAVENMTNTNGEFKFEIPQGSEILVISAKGYKPQEIPITKSRTYPVTLEQ